jgi:hypothetical protein
VLDMILIASVGSLDVEYAHRGYVVLMRLAVVSCCRLLANLV